jgi:hypothetical protein
VLRASTGLRRRELARHDPLKSLLLYSLMTGGHWSSCGGLLTDLSFKNCKLTSAAAGFGPIPQDGEFQPSSSDARQVWGEKRVDIGDRAGDHAQRAFASFGRKESWLHAATEQRVGVSSSREDACSVQATDTKDSVQAVK